MEKTINLQSLKSFFSVRILKAVLAVLIFVSILINGLVPKNIENKEVILEIIGAVVNNVVLETFKDCTETLVVMSNKITKDLYKLLQFGNAETKVPLNDEKGKQETPVSTGSDFGIIPQNRDQIEILNVKENDDGAVYLGIEKAQEQLYKLYCSLKVFCSKRDSFGLMLFILFVVGIVRRKFRDAIETYKIYIGLQTKGKTNLC